MVIKSSDFFRHFRSSLFENTRTYRPRLLSLHKGLRQGILRVEQFLALGGHRHVIFETMVSCNVKCPVQNVTQKLQGPIVLTNAV